MTTSYDDEGDDLRSEIEQMFKEEQTKAKYEAKKTWNMPAGYYDELTMPSSEYRGREHKVELTRIRREKHKRKKKNGTT